MDIQNTNRGNCWRNSRSSSAGLTVIELLVVIAILGVVMSMMMPTISLARTKMKISRSMNNLKHIGTYVFDYHLNNDGYGAARTDGGCWLTPKDGNRKNYYWGSAYSCDKEWFNSPLTFTTLEENTDGSRLDGHKYVDYGFNGVASLWYDETGTFENIRRGTSRNIDTYLQPAQTIWAHDHSEPMIDGDGDVPCYAFARDQNAFNQGHPDFNPDAEHRANSEIALQEIFRNRGMCGVLWADNHVSKLGSDHAWKPEWYTGYNKGPQKAWEEQEDGKFTQPPPYRYSLAYIGRL